MKLRVPLKFCVQYRAGIAVAMLLVASTLAPSPQAARADAPQTAAPAAVPKPALDRSGRKRTGKASFYAKKFAGRKMADGTPMRPHENAAASKSLPLGTVAKVTNLETGKSAVVTIRDRGPFVHDRLLDLSPATADKIGIAHADGIAKIEVTPLSVPQADGTTKPGAAAASRNN